ncbi:MAG: ATP-binding protein, partial [Actinomycetota bacterium]|nr:ATP-binding protein [Actinomycetota bacterium]
GFLGPVARQRATILKPGSMFVIQPELPIPLLAEFPFPAWASRPSEAADRSAGNEGSAADDPFAGLDG